MVSRISLCVLSVLESRSCHLRVNLLIRKGDELEVQEILNDIIAFLLLACLQISVGLEDLLAGVVIVGVHDNFELVRSITCMVISFRG